MALDQRKFEHKHEVMLRDVRPMGQRISETLEDSSTSAAFFAALAFFIGSGNPWAVQLADLLAVVMGLYFWWLTRRDRSLAFKMPLGTRYLDKNNGRGGKKGKAEGIMYMGNTQKTGEEVWFTNSDIRTHILYLGTTGAGKTEGLKSLVTNALAWSSGFVYVDGKADTDLWSSLSSLVRRFGRDDDLLVLNYMTGNSDAQAPSNSMNPFSGGSASYLTNMLVSLMPESGGDNAMWKERAVSLVGSMMPALTWKRDNQEIPLSVRNIRDYLSLNNIIKLSRDDIIPKEIRAGLIGYLDTLPGFIGDAYDDEGNVKPPGPDTPQYNTETASQQHGYLAMQFTRSLQSLGDDYGYIFDTQAADVDMVDVVLNRRILVVLVPALEKSGDEVANLGKIVASSIKGMMGSTLGATVEGSSASVIENKPTHSSTPFLTVFDEVGYYVAEGMAVMAAQARSLGFSLVFAGQDLPALKKRVREEANSITANCNVKLFGKLEDPTETKDFFEKTVGSALVTEVSGFQMAPGSSTNYYGSQQAGVQLRPRANYDELRGFKEGQAVVTFGEQVFDCAVFYSNPGFAKAMRVTRFMALPPPDENILKYSNLITKLRDLMVNKTWAAERADVAVETSPEIAALGEGFTKHNKPKVNPVDAGIAALVEVHAISNEIPQANETGKTGGTKSSGGGVKPAAPPPQQSDGQKQAAASPLQQRPAQQKAPAAATTPQTPQQTQRQLAPATPPPHQQAPQQPATPPPQQQTPQAPATSEEAKLAQAAQNVKENVFNPQSGENNSLVKAAQNVKKNLFEQQQTKAPQEASGKEQGQTQQPNTAQQQRSAAQQTPQQQAPLVPTEQTPHTSPARPQQPAQQIPQQEQEKTNEQNKKPAIFGAGSTSKPSDDSKDDKEQ